MDNFCVYSYRDPREELPFYIGKGRPSRPYEHLLDCRLTRTTHFYNRLNKVLGEGIAPVILILASNLPEQSAIDLEVSLIKQYGRLDVGSGCLTNHTDGGDGVSGGHWSLLLRSTEHCLAQSKPRTPEARTNIKAGAAGRKRPVESFDLKTDITIKRYEMVKDVQKDGFNRKAVTSCLSGKTKSSGSRGWRYI